MVVLRDLEGLSYEEIAGGARARARHGEIEAPSGANGSAREARTVPAMTCHDAREQFSALVDDALAADERADARGPPGDVRRVPARAPALPRHGRRWCARSRRSARRPASSTACSRRRGRCPGTGGCVRGLFAALAGEAAHGGGRDRAGRRRRGAACTSGRRSSQQAARLEPAAHPSAAPSSRTPSAGARGPRDPARRGPSRTRGRAEGERPRSAPAPAREQDAGRGSAKRRRRPPEPRRRPPTRRRRPGLTDRAPRRSLLARCRPGVQDAAGPAGADSAPSRRPRPSPSASARSPSENVPPQPAPAPAAARMRRRRGRRRRRVARSSARAAPTSPAGWRSSDRDAGAARRSSSSPPAWAPWSTVAGRRADGDDPRAHRPARRLRRVRRASSPGSVAGSRAPGAGRAPRPGPRLSCASPADPPLRGRRGTSGGRLRSNSVADDIAEDRRTTS